MLNLPVYTKYEALRTIFECRDLFNKWPSKKVTADNFLEIISKDAYNLKEDLNICAASVCRITSKAFPDKPRTSGKVCGFLLNIYGYKCCAKCCMVLPLIDYHTNSTKNYGKNSYCKLCFNDSVRDYRKYYTALHKSYKLKRTPSWANLEEIKSFYANCPEGYHVDHIIPLLGNNVSGMHVINNLQYLLAKENIKKSNTYIPE